MRAGAAAILLFASSLSGGDFALTGATVYPSPDAHPIFNAVIVIRGARITAARPRASVRIPKGVQAVDCSGKYVVAGFWNSHVHTFTPGLLRAADASTAQMNAELDAMFNRCGFTTVFDIASVLANTLALRRRIESGELQGPRILTAGEPVWTKPPIYVLEYLEANRIRIPEVTTADAARRKVRTLTEAGADGIKLFTGSVQGGGKTDNMPIDLVRASVEEAHRRNLPVFAHAQNLTGLEAAIAGGVDVLAHTAPDSPAWTLDFVRRLMEARIALIPTLTLFDFEARKARASNEERRAWIDKMQAQLRSFSNARGEVLFGTDVGYTDHYDTTLEYALMSRAGMSFRQILASLTTNPAGRFGYAARSGRVAKGTDADITVLKSDPAKDVSAFSEIQLTIRAGRIIYSSN
jgi:imidazolonepropionase-like amidohydrolase